jgi:hypothetical protein
LATDYAKLTENLSRFYDFTDKEVLFIGAAGRQLLDPDTRTRKLIAIDKDVETLKDLKAKIVAQGLQDSVSVVGASFEDVTLHGDVVYFEFCLHEMDDPEKALMQLLPVLNQEVSERYAIPPSPAATITYTGLPLDEIEDALQRSAAMQNARGILVRKQQKMSGRPVTRLHKGRVGLLACSGMLNGFFGEGDMRHIAHWRSVKHVDEFNEDGETEGEMIIRKRERFSHELTLAYESGRILELKETKEARVGNEKCS